jgi:hypothetical protein
MSALTDPPVGSVVELMARLGAIQAALPAGAAYIVALDHLAGFAGRGLLVRTRA